MGPYNYYLIDIKNIVVVSKPTYKEVKAFDSTGLYFVSIQIMNFGVVMWMGKDYDQVNGFAPSREERVVDKDVTDNFSALSKLFK